MKRRVRTLVSMIIALTMLVPTVLPVATTSAAENSYGFIDFPTGWSSPAMSHAVENGLIYGKSSDRIAPQDNLTRAEMATIINRAFGATVTKDISQFADVAESQWYYNDIKKAYNMQTLYGDAGGTMRPDAFIIREEAIAIVARAMVLSGYEASNLDRFKDKDQIADWAVDPLASMAANGYVNGDEKSNMNPKAFITREEFAQLLYNIIKHYYNADNKQETYQGNLMLNKPDISLEKITVNGDLVLGDGVGTSVIKLTDVKITGRLLVRGAAQITLKNVTADKGVTVKNVNGTVHFDNYREEKIFDGVIEHTKVTYKQKSAGGGGGGTPPTANYKVEHYKEALDGSFALSETETLSGTIDGSVSATAKDATTDTDYVGFSEDTTHPSRVATGTVTADGSLVLKLYYTRNKYAVNYNFGGATTTLPASQLHKYEEVVNLPTSGFSYPGKVFLGWFETETGGSPVTQITVGAAPVTVYARWDDITPGTPVFTVEHYKQNIDETYPAAPFETDVTQATTIGTVLKAQDFDKTYTGFTVDLAGSPDVTVAGAGAFILKIYYTRNTYTFTFDEQGGSISGTPKTVYKFGETLELPIPTKGTDTFGGWWTAPNGTGTKIENTSILGTDITSAAITVYAHWVSTTATFTVEHYQEDFYGNWMLFDIDLEQTIAIGTVLKAQNYKKDYPGFTVDLANSPDVTVTSGNNTLAIYYTRDEYTVTYNFNNGTPATVHTVTLKYGMEVDLTYLPTDTVPGKFFAGWYDAPTGGIQHTSLWVPAENITLYAQWSDNPGYAIEYWMENADNDEYTRVYREVKNDVAEGQTATIPAEIFEYFTEIVHPQTNTSGVVTATPQLTLKRFYNRARYTITFEYQGADGGVIVPSKEYKHEQTIDLPFPSKTGYTLEGWFTGIDGTGEKIFDGSQITSGGILYAYWVPALVDFTVAHYKQELDGTYPATPSQTETKEEYTNTVVDAVDYKLDFTGFIFDTSSPSVTVLADGTAVLKIYYTRETYTVTFDTGLGTAVAPVEYKYGQAFAEPTTTRPGYAVEGWYTSPNGGGTKITTASLAGVDFTGITIYANWTALPSDFTVKHYKQNVDDDLFAEPETETKSALTDSTVSATTYKKQYAGFTVDLLSSVDVTVSADGSTVLNIYYNRNKHSVTYNYENGVTAPSTVPNVKYGAQVNLAEPERSLWPAGKYFTGWSLTQNGAVIVAYPMPDEDLNLYAVWGNNPSYQVQYLFENADDDNYSINPAYSTAKNDVVEGETASIPELSPIPTGFEAYPGYSEEVLSGTVTADPQLILKRFYKRERFTVALNYQGADGNNTVLSQTYKFEQTENLPTPTKTGYDFAGWFTAPDSTGVQIADGGKITSGGTLYAKWTPDIVDFKVEHYKQELDGTYSSIPAQESTEQEYTETVVDAVDYKTNFAGFTFDVSSPSVAILPDGSAVLKIYYTRNAHNITYNYENGVTAPSTVPNVKYGAQVNLAEPERSLWPAGKYFTGWSLTQNGAVIVAYPMPDEDLNLYAVWGNNLPYQLQYLFENADDDDYTINPAYSTAKNDTLEGETATIPELSQIPFGFEAYPGYSQEVLSGTVTADPQLVLKRFYKRVRFTLTFDYQGGSVTGEPKTQYKYEETIQLPAATKTGYEFAGWFTEAVGGTQITTTNKVTENITYYAHWTPALVNVTVEHLFEKLDGTYDKQTETTTEYTESMVKPDDYDTAVDGFIFDATRNAQTEVLADGSTVVKVYYLRNSYTVNFDFGVGATVEPSTPTSKTDKYEAIVVLPTSGFTNGLKTFAGWYDAPTGGNKITQIAVPLGGTTVYARWADTYFTVKHLVEPLSGTTYTQYGSDVRVVAEAGSRVKPEDYDIVIDGFAFDTLRNAEITVAENNTTVLEVYYTRNTYTVTYNFNNGTTPDTHTEDYKYGESINLAFVPTVTVSNKHFAGWYGAPQGGQQLTYLPMPSGGTTIYAQWSDNPGYAIEYWHENADDDGYSIASRTVKNDATEGELATIPVRDFANFSEIIHPQTTLSGTVSSTVELILKRYYQRERFTVTLEYNGATGGNTTSSQEYKFEQTENLPTPTKTGYDFAGWFTASDDTGVKIEDGQRLTVGGTLYAKWTPAKVKITVVHHLQNIETDDFTPLPPDVTKKAYAGSTVKPENYYDSGKEGFRFDDTQNAEVTVLADGKTIINVYYLRNRYDVIYDYNNTENPGKIVKNLKYGANVDLAVKPDVQVANRFFAGWFTKATGGEQITSLTTPVGGTTLYAKWELNPGYAYEYYHENIYNDGYTLVERTVYNDKTAGSPVGPIPEKVYDGFNENLGLAELYGNVSSDGSLALKRFYNRERYNVTFDYRGATAGVISKEYKYGQPADLPMPTREFYDFKGWFTEVNGGGSMIDNQDLAGKGFVSGTLYAHWEFNWDGEVKFTAKIAEEDSDNDMFSVIVAVSNNPVGIAKYDLELSYDASVEAIWDEQEEVVVHDLKGFGDTAAPIQTTANDVRSAEEAAALDSITVTWDNSVANGGDGLNKKGNANLFKIRFKIVGTKEDKNHEEETPSPMLFRMRRAISLNNNIIIEGLTSIPFTLEATNVAVKIDESDDTSYQELEKATEGDSLEPYMIEHYKENADNDNYAKAYTQYGHGVLGSEITAQLRDEYLDQHFTKNEDISDTSARLVSGGAILRIYYIRPRYTVTFDYQEADITGVASKEFKAGALVYEDLPAEDTFGKTDYNFSGWYTDRNGQGTKVDENYTAPFEDVTLYAYWTQTPYRVEHYFEALDGTFAIDNSKTQTKQAKAGTIVTAQHLDVLGFEYDESKISEISKTLEEGSTLDEVVTVLKVYYKRNAYTIVLDYNGADVRNGEDTYTFKYEQTTDLPTPEKTGYEFAGWWYTDAGSAQGETQLQNNTPFEATDVTDVYAKWTAVEVSYIIEHYYEKVEGGYGEPVIDDSQKAVTGTTVADKYNTNVTGFTYNSAAEGTDASAEVNRFGTTTLKYYYTRNTYKLTLNFGEGATVDSSINQTPSVKYEDTYQLPTTGFTNGSKTFLGWFDAQVGGNKIERVTMGAANTEVYARWEENVGVYTVEFYQQNLNGASYTRIDEDTQTGLTGVIGTYVSVDANSDEIKNKYEGFEVNPIITRPIKLKATGTVLKVYYDRKTYTIGYEFEGGEADGTYETSFKYGEKVTLPKATHEDGKTLAGWYTEAGGNGNRVGNGNEIVDILSVIDVTGTTITLYANWVENYAEYSIEFYQQNLDGEGYTIVAEDTQTGLSGTVGKTVKVDATLDVIKNKYLGFTVNADESTLSQTLAATGTVLKVYYDRNQYTLVYNYSEADLTGVESATFKYGQTITFPDTFAKDGYQFAGWYSSANFAEDELLDLSVKIQDVVDIEGGETQATIYAKWAKVFIVTFREGATLIKDAAYTVDPAVSNTVPYSAFPYDKLDERYKTGYFEDESVSSVYAGNEYQHTFEGEWYYTDENGEDVIFTDKTVVNRDITVRYIFRYVRLELFVEQLGHNLVLEVPFEESTRLIDSIKDELFVNQEKILLVADEVDARSKFMALNLKLVNFLESKGIEIVEPGMIFAEDGEILKQHIKFNAFAYLDEASTKTFVVKAIRTTFENDPLRMRGVIDEMMKEQDKDVVDLMDTMLVSMLSGVDGERIKGIIADAVETAIEYNDNDTVDERAEKDEFRQKIKDIIVSRLDAEASPEFTGEKVVTQSVKDAVYNYFMDKENDENIRKTVIDLINDAYEVNENGEPINPEVRSFVKSYITDYFKSDAGTVVFDNLILELGETLDADNPDDKPIIDLIHDVLAKDDRSEEGLTYLEELVDGVIEDLHILAEEENGEDGIYTFVVDAITTELTNDPDELELLIRTIGGAEPADLKAVLATAMENDSVFETVVKTAVEDDGVFADVIGAAVSNTGVFETVVRELCETESDFYTILADIALGSTTLKSEVMNTVVNNDDALISVLKTVSSDTALKEEIIDEILTAGDAELKGKLTNPIYESSAYYASVKSQALSQAETEIIGIIETGINEDDHPDYWPIAFAKAMEVAEAKVRQDLIDNSVDPNGSLWDTLYQEAMAQAEIDVTAKLNGGITDANSDYYIAAVNGAKAQAETEITNLLATGIEEDSKYWQVAYDTAKSILRQEIETNFDSKIDEIKTDATLNAQVKVWAQSSVGNPDIERAIKDLAKGLATSTEPDDIELKASIIDTVITTVEGAGFDTAGLASSITTELNKATNSDIKVKVVDKAVAVLNQDAYADIKTDLIADVLAEVLPDQGEAEENKADIVEELVDQLVEQVNNDNGQPGGLKDTVISIAIDAVVNDSHVNKEAIAIINKLIDESPAENPDGTPTFKEKCITHIITYILDTPNVREEAMKKVVTLIETPYDPEIPGAIDYKSEAIDFAFDVLGTPFKEQKRLDIANKLLDSILNEVPVNGVYEQREGLANNVKDVMFNSGKDIRDRILDIGFEQMFAGDIEGFVSLALDELIGDDDLRREMIIAVISTESGRRSILDILFDELERDSTFIDEMVDIAMKGKYGDMVDKFVHDLINNGLIEINPDNRQIAEEIVLPMLDDFTLDTVMSKLPSKVTDILPEGKIETIFNKFKTKARELLVEGINEAKDGNSKAISVMIDNELDIINELLVPVYNKIFPRVVDKAEDFYYYDENVYLKAIVDMIDPSFLLDNSMPASEGGTGYRLRTTEEYYKILRNISVLVDDAANWYMENISDDQINGAIDKVAGKVNALLTKLNSFVGGRIPVSKVDKIVEYTKKALDKRERVYNVTTTGTFEKADKVYNKLIDIIKDKTGVDVTKSTTIEVTFDGSRLAVNDKDVNIDNYEISISVKGYSFKLDSESITVLNKTVDIERFVQKAADLFGTRSVTFKIINDAPYSYGAYVGNNYIRLAAEYK